MPKKAPKNAGPAPSPAIAERDPWIGRAAVAISVGASIFVFLHLQPSLMFADTTAAGGDLGAHAMGPDFLRGHLLDDGLLSGWTNMWWGGFPAFRYYMSLPMFFAVLVGAVLPTTVALKVVVAVPLIALPLVVHRLIRSFGWSAPAGALGAVASVVFLFDDSNLKLGGTIASTVVGEFAYTYGLVFSLCALASFNHLLARPSEQVAAGPGTLFGLAAACHPIAAFYSVIGIIVRAVAQPATDRRRAIRFGGITLVLGGLIAAFWYLPVALNRTFFNDLRNARDTKFGSLLFSMPWLVTLIVLAFAVLGVARAIQDRNLGTLSFAVTTVLMGFGVLVAPTGVIWNARLAPLWQIGLVVLAAIGAYAAIEYIQLTARQNVAAVGVVFGLVVLMVAWDMGTLPGSDTTTTTQGELTFATSSQWIVGPEHEPNSVREIVTAGFGGYERGPNWSSYEELQGALEKRVEKNGCGRVMAEFDPSGRFGSTYAVPMIPHFSDACLSSVMGFYTESSPTAPVALVAESAVSPVFSSYEPGLPYEGVDLERGVQYLRELGARYYVVFTPELRELARTTDGLESVAKSEQWELFEVEGANLVEPLLVEPVEGGASGGEEWQADELEWFKAADPNEPRFAPSPPDDWSVPATGSVSVSNIEVDDDSISFDVDRPGEPVLVRENYFTGWKAVGADGPHRVAPNWMVVIPTGTSVRLERGGETVPWVGAALTLLGLVGAGVIEIRRRRGSPAEETTTEG